MRKKNKKEKITDLGSGGIAPVSLLDHRRRMLRKLPCAKDWYFIAEQPAPAPHLPHPEGCAALSTVLVTVPRVGRSCEHFPDGFDLHLIQGRVPRAVIMPPPCRHC